MNHWPPSGLAPLAVLCAACIAVQVAPSAAQNPPDPPAAVTPTPDATVSQLPPALTVRVEDPDADSLTVTIWGRPVTTANGPDFSLIEIPDTQYYSGSLNGGNPGLFSAQTRWIAAHRTLRNIAYVAHVGDIVQNEDNGGDPIEWISADSCMARLEDPATTLLPEGIPYGAVPGNHDIQGNGDDDFYNQFFGLARFQGRVYYGGHFGDDNSSWFDRFSASGLDFIVIGIKLDWNGDPAVVQWADSLLSAFPNRRAILVSHSLLDPGPPVTFTPQAQMIYDALKGHANLILMLCGHAVDEARRADTFAGHTIHTVMANYQGRAHGGDGWFRIMDFSPARNVIRFRTFSPTLGLYESDPDSSSQFTLDCDLSGGDGAFHPIATFPRVPSGATVSVPWAGLQRGQTYQWYATVSDGSGTVTGPTWQFQTADDAAPVATVTVPDGAEMLTVTHDLKVTWETANLPGTRRVDVEISRSGPDGPWETLATDVPDLGSWQWRVSTPVTSNAFMRVVVRNDQAIQVSDTSDLPFAIVTPVASGVDETAPRAFALDAVVPNPSRGGCRVRFTLARADRIRLEVVDLAGRRVARLVDGSRAAGAHEIAWDGRVGGAAAPAGLYFVRLHAGSQVVSRRIAVVR